MYWYHRFLEIVKRNVWYVISGILLISSLYLTMCTSVYANVVAGKTFCEAYDSECFWGIDPAGGGGDGTAGAPSADAGTPDGPDQGPAPDNDPAPDTDDDGESSDKGDKGGKKGGKGKGSDKGKSGKGDKGKGGSNGGGNGGGHGGKK